MKVGRVCDPPFHASSVVRRAEGRSETGPTRWHRHPLVARSFSPRLYATPAVRFSVTVPAKDRHYELHAFQQLVQAGHHGGGVVEQAGGDEGVVEELLGDEFGLVRVAGVQRMQMREHGVARIDLQVDAEG